MKSTTKQIRDYANLYIMLANKIAYRQKPTAVEFSEAIIKILAEQLAIKVLGEVNEKNN